MEDPFFSFQERMKEHLQTLEAQCNDVLGSMRAENSHLRRQLIEAREARSCKEQNAGIGHSGLKCKASLAVEKKNSFISAGSPPQPGRQLKMSQSALQVLLQPACDSPVEWVPDRDSLQLPAKGSLDESDVHLLVLDDTDTHDVKTDRILRRWERFCIGLNAPNKEKEWLRTQAYERHMNLRPFWTVGHQIKRTHPSTVSSPRKTRRALLSSDDSGICVGALVLDEESRFQRCTIHPESLLSLAHAVIQGALIFFDVIDFPLSVFFDGGSDFATAMLILSTCFWTWNLLFSFFLGYHSDDGVIEMRPARIAHHYIRRWFIFDFVLVALDWVSLIVYIVEQANSRESRIARATKISKAQRITRGGRILRLVKAVDKIHAFIDAGASADSVVVVARIFGLVLMIILINHYVACAWYAVASSSSRQDTWVRMLGLENAKDFDKYFYSLHWSLTQFTPSTTDIAPVNGMERFFACFIVLFALVVFSTFLSSLTTAIIQLKNNNYEWYNERVRIRDFLYHKQVPLTVANRVWHFYRRHYRLRAKIVAESDIRFFKAMPKSLRKELHSYAYIRTLENHPVIKLLVEGATSTLGPSLSELVSTLIPDSGHDIFLEQDVATHMFYIVGGSLTYSLFGRDTVVRHPDHITEAVLWLNDWHHLGRLTVTDNRCEMLLLGAIPFISCISNEASEGVIRSLRKYATLFAQYQADKELDCVVKVSSMRKFAQLFTDRRRESWADIARFEVPEAERHSEDSRRRASEISNMSDVNGTVNKTAYDDDDDDEGPVEWCSDLPLGNWVTHKLICKAFHNGNASGSFDASRSKLWGHAASKESITLMWIEKVKDNFRGGRRESSGALESTPRFSAIKASTAGF